MEKYIFRVIIKSQKVGDGSKKTNLHVHLNELVAGVELLTHQTLLIEVRGDDDPARFLQVSKQELSSEVIRADHELCDTSKQSNDAEL